MSKRMRVYECWAQARREYPDSPDAMRMRYAELMRDNGLLVPKKPGDDGSLPCGWKP